MSMRTALTGLSASQTELSTIANNIANSATTGFKRSRTEFADLFSADSSGRTPGTGVRVAGVTQQMKQGGLEFTGNTLDLAISGNGYFMLKDGSSTSYTRSGNFRLDTSGNVVSPGGSKLQFQSTSETTVFELTVPPPSSGPLGNWVQGTSTNLKSVNVNSGVEFSAAIGSQPGKSITVSAYKVDATNPTGTPINITATTAQGVADQVNAANIDNLTASVVGGEVRISYLGEGTVKITNWSDSPGSQTFSGITPPLSIARLEVDKEGVLRRTLSDGTIQDLGTVAVSTFSTPSNLAQAGDNSWRSTIGSGSAVTDKPGVGDRGKIEAGALEASNVEVTQELVAMITAQRNFQANAKTISTADQIAQAILNIR